MKKILLLTLCIIPLIVLFFGENVYAGAINIQWTDEIADVSLNLGTSGNAIEDISDTWFSILRTVKVITMWLFVIFLVYIGAQMIMSMGSNEEELSSAKRQIWYALIALVFINIPGTLYEAFYKDDSTTIGNRVSTGNFEDLPTESGGNMFVDMFVFGHTLNSQIVMFLEIIVFMIAIFMITLSGLQLILSHGKEDSMKKAKQKVMYTVIALIFVWIIEAWKRLAFGGEVKDGINLFQSVANLVLFFAVPIAVFFLTLAGYYYITANGDEERVKRAKNIVINTLLASLILLISWTFLSDLATI